MTNHPKNLPSLDVGRFVAAFLVLLFHFGYGVRDFTGVVPFGALFRGGHAGVEYFFVLSGFIIYYVHQNDLSRPAEVGAFARKRATRILPFLWLTLLGWTVIRYALASYTAKVDTTLGTLLLDLFLIPHSGALVLPVIWTLKAELVFYLFFAVLILNKRIGFGLILAWQLAILVSLPFALQLSPFPATVLSVYNLGFGAGLLIALLITRGVNVGRVPLAVIGGGAFVALMLAEWWIGGPYDAGFRPLGQILSPILHSLAAAALVMGLALKDIARPVTNRLLKNLGGSSYVLYLIHGPLGAMLVRVLVKTPLVHSSEALLLVSAAICVAAALALHLYVELPILRWLRPRPPLGNV